MNLTPLPWQASALQLRTHVDLVILAGGRAGGKTFCALLALIAHCSELGKDASPLMVRESWSGLGESMLKAYEMCSAVFGPTTSYNKADAIITLPTGGRIYGCSLHEGEASYVRWQGRNLTMVFCDEVGQLPAHHFAFMRRLESNLRPPVGFKAERWWGCNPGGKAHTMLLKNWISKTPPWKIARDRLGLSYVVIPSVFTDNRHVEPESYRRNLTASVGADKALADAWLAGSWANISSAMFPVNPDVHLIPRMPPEMLRGRARFTCGSDWGTAAPATATLIAQLREALNFEYKRYPYGSIIAVDETSTVLDPHDLSVGSGLDPRTFAEQIRTMLGKWGAEQCEVFVDDAKGLKGDSVKDYFRAAGLRARVPNKRSRIEGWDIIRQHLAYSETRRGSPLYFTTDCPFLFDSLGNAPRGTLNPRDLDPKWNEDHFVDAFAYAMKEVAGGPRSWSGTYIGYY